LPGFAPVSPNTQIQDDRPGKPLCVLPEAIDRYALQSEIGRGGMGAVYFARDTRLHRDVAVKVLHDRYTAGGVAAARFIEEARITGQLQHPGIPPVHDLGTLPDGRPFMAMKLIRGRTLAARLAAADRPDFTRLITYFEKICETVAYAHEKHVIHRDLKPANVMVGAFGEVQVMDWGLAKVIADPNADPDQPAAANREESEHASDPILSERDPESHTLAGSAMGTLAYMPPEQAKGEIDRINARADVFCLGGILCEMLTGTAPYAGTATELRAKATLGHLSDAYARLDACGADAELIALAKWCLSSDPLDRPADATAVAAAMTAYRDGLDARLRKAEVDRAKAETQAAESRKRARLRLVLAGLGLVFVVVFTIYNLRLSKANNDTKNANDEASRANDAARRANQAAKDNNALTEDAIDQFVAGLGENDKLKKYDDLREVRRKLLETAVDFNKKLLARGGDEPRLRYKRGEVHNTLGLLYTELENPDQSEAEFQSARTIFDAIYEAQPNDDAALAGLASATNRLGNTHERIAELARDRDPERAKNEQAKAASAYDEAIRLRQILVDRSKADEHRIDLATSLSNLAGLCSAHPKLAKGRPDPAASFRKAEALLLPIVNGPNPPLQAERQFAKLETNFATYLFVHNDPTFPQVLTTAKGAFERIVHRYPDSDDLRFEYVIFADKVGQMWFVKDKFDEAETWLALAAKQCGGIVADHPGVVRYRIQYVDTLLRQAVSGYNSQKQTPEQFLPLFRAAIDQAKRIDADPYHQAEVRELGGIVCEQWAAALTGLNRLADVVPVWNEALAFAPPARIREIELRRELARCQAGDALLAVKNARSYTQPPLKTAEEYGYFAAVLAVAADTKKNGKPLFPTDDIEKLRGEVTSSIEKAKGLPDYDKTRIELTAIPALKLFLNPK
jgi:hypothetical protein